MTKTIPENKTSASSIMSELYQTLNFSEALQCRDNTFKKYKTIFKIGFNTKDFRFDLDQWTTVVSREEIKLQDWG